MGPKTARTIDRPDIRWAALLIGIVAMVSVAGTALALSGDDAVQARRARFGEMTDALKFAANHWDETDRYAEIANAMKVIARDAKTIPKLFPAGTGIGQGFRTAALDAIWRDKPGFERLANALADEAALLSSINTATPTGDVRHQLEAMIATCKACHRDFRAN